MRSHRLCVAVTVAAAVAACGGKTDDAIVTSTGDASTDTRLADSGSPEISVDSVIDAPVEAPLDAPSVSGAEPPARPATSATGGATKWFVVKHLYLGLSDRSTGMLSADAWKQYGFDLDHRTTTAEDSKTSFDSCVRVAGSPSGVLMDGDLGRDNNFGAHVMQTLKSLKSDIEDYVNTSIASGTPTILLRIDDVVGDDNATVPGALYQTGALSGAPAFDGSDVYPVDTASVTGGDLSKPIETFPGGYMSGGVWVSGDSGGGSFSVPLVVGGAPLSLNLRAAVVVFRVSDGTGGTFAGLITDDDYAKAITPAMKAYGVCPGTSTFDVVVQDGVQASDLVAAAPELQDTTKTCDSLSLGVGFDVAPAMPPTSVVPTPAGPPSSCP